jgi:hypothetical protein
LVLLLLPCVACAALLLNAQYGAVHIAEGVVQAASSSAETAAGFDKYVVWGESGPHLLQVCKRASAAGCSSCNMIGCCRILQQAHHQQLLRLLSCVSLVFLLHLLPPPGKAAFSACAAAIAAAAAAAAADASTATEHLLRGELAIVDSAMPPGTSASASTPGFTLLSDNCKQQQRANHTASTVAHSHHICA